MITLIANLNLRLGYFVYINYVVGHFYYSFSVVEYEVNLIVPFFANWAKPPLKVGLCLIDTSGILPTEVIAGSTFMVIPICRISLCDQSSFMHI